MAFALFIGLVLALVGFTLPLAIITSDRLQNVRITIGTFNAFNAFLWTLCYNTYKGAAIGFGISILTTVLLIVYRMVSRSR